MTRSRREIDLEFVVVCGCPRSGTTLLAEQLGQRFGVALPIETHFIPHFARVIGLWGDLSRADLQTRLLAALETYTRVWLYRGTRFRSPDKVMEFSVLPAITRAQPDHGGVSALFHAIFRGYAAQFGLSHYGDKSAPFEPESLPHYDKCISGLRVVHIIRDGRDVCLSWRGNWFGPHSVAEAAWMWRRHIEARRAWGRQNPDRYLEVHYEDLVSNPEAAFADIAMFLRLPEITADARKPILAATVAEEPVHRKLSEPPNAEHVRRWPRSMPSRDIELFELIAGRTLQACQYPRSDQRPSWLHRVGLVARAAGGLAKRYVTSTYYLRRARALMPLALGSAQAISSSYRRIRLRS